MTKKFKVPCLLNIKSLFLNETKPFHAGFGNRDTVETYLYRMHFPTLDQEL